MLDLCNFHPTISPQEKEQVREEKRAKDSEKHSPNPA
jgi:hypothetical protein